MRSPRWWGVEKTEAPAVVQICRRRSHVDTHVIAMVDLNDAVWVTLSRLGLCYSDDGLVTGRHFRRLGR